MSRKHPKNPSFSSILLDEMFRSIDGTDEKFEDIKVYNEQSTRKYTKTNYDVNRVKIRRNTISLPEIKSRSLPDNDHPMLFSTSSRSSTSDSSSNGFSSSDVEFYGSAKSKKSSSYYDQNVYRTEENVIRNNSRALKIYYNFKKMKQPISPGGRLTNFINSLFTNGNAKKTNKNLDDINGRSIERKVQSSINASTCSSASSFPKSCLSKSKADSRSKFVNNSVNRTVRFEDNRQGRKHITETIAEVKSRVREENKKSKERSRDILEGYMQDPKKDYFMKDRVNYQNDGRYEDEDEDEAEDDAASDASSDLFEIDHLAMCRDKRFCDELPVYETTHLDRNRAIARGLIC